MDAREAWREEEVEVVLGVVVVFINQVPLTSRQKWHVARRLGEQLKEEARKEEAEEDWEVWKMNGRPVAVLVAPDEAALLKIIEEVTHLHIHFTPPSNKK